MPGKLIFASLWTLGLLLGMLGAVVFVALYAAGIFEAWLLIVATVALNLLIWLIAPRISDWIQRLFYRMRFISREELARNHPDLDSFIAHVSEKYGFRYPKIGFIEDDNPTAYTYGSGRWNARIIFTRGLFTYLEPNEVRAVIGHELGHVKNRDFIIMAIANTIIQLLYELYYIFRSNRRLAPIAWLAYLFYWVGVYIALFLSRIREYYADQFAAQETGQPHDLSKALIKIAYGIMAKEEDEKSLKLLESTRTMGILGFRTAKETGLVAKVTNMEPAKITNVMLYDIVSPWARLAELSSTHPLTGKRLRRLEAISEHLGQHPYLDFKNLKQAAAIDRGRLWRGFFFGAFMYLLPVIALLGVLVAAVFVFLTNTPLIPALLVSFAVLVLLFTARALYRYPSIRKAQASDTLTLMSDLYASPIRGRPVEIHGAVVGRGTPGYVFGEDMMLQDRTGLLYLDFQGLIPLFSRLRFALKKLKKLFGQSMAAHGWFFRANVQKVVLRSIKTPDNHIRSYAKFWALAGAPFIAALLTMPIAIAAAWAQDQPLAISSKYEMISTPCFDLKVPSNSNLPAHSDKKFCNILLEYPGLNLLNVNNYHHFYVTPEPNEGSLRQIVDKWKSQSQPKVNVEESLTVGSLPAWRIIYEDKIWDPGKPLMTVFIDTTSYLKSSYVSSGGINQPTQTPTYIKVEASYDEKSVTPHDQMLQSFVWKRHTLIYSP